MTHTIIDKTPVKKEHKLCICCMEKHDVSTIETMAKDVFKGIEIDYKATCSYCDKTDKYFETEDQITANDIAMKDEYRKKNNLLTSAEICGIRAKYKISQSDLCLLLDWDTNTVAKYETHQVQDIAYNDVLQKINDDPDWFIKLLNKNKDKLSEASYEKSLKAATVRSKTLYPYRFMPNFSGLLKKYGKLAVKECLILLENTKYMTYAISYLKNHRQPVFRIDDSYNAKYAETIYNMHTKEFDFYKFISKLYDIVKKDAYELFTKETSADPNADPDTNKEFGDLITNKNRFWEIICPKMFYNEVENPSAVKRILDWMFETEPASPENHRVCIYDFSSYDVMFPNAKDADMFVKDFVQTAVVYESSDAGKEWIERYSV